MIKAVRRVLNVINNKVVVAVVVFKISVVSKTLRIYFNDFSVVVDLVDQVAVLVDQAGAVLILILEINRGDLIILDSNNNNSNNNRNHYLRAQTWLR